MKTYVINLKRRPDRREYMQAQLDALGVSYEFVDAVDARADGYAETLRHSGIALDGPLGPLTLPTLACTLSHLKVYQLIAQSDSECALILEDDAKLAPAFASVANDDQWLPEDANVVRIEHWDDPRQVIVTDRRFKQWGRFAIKRLRSRTAGSAGYVITKAFAQYLLATPQLFQVPIDHVLFNRGASAVPRKHQVLQLIPSVVVQDAIWGSDLSASHPKKSFSSQWSRGLIEIRQALPALCRVALGLSVIEKNRFDG